MNYMSFILFHKELSQLFTKLKDFILNIIFIPHLHWLRQNVQIRCKIIECNIPWQNIYIFYILWVLLHVHILLISTYYAMYT